MGPEFQFVFEVTLENVNTAIKVKRYYAEFGEDSDQAWRKVFERVFKEELGEDSPLILDKMVFLGRLEANN